MYTHTVHGDCEDGRNVHTSSREEYKRQAEFIGQGIMLHKFNDVINTCKLGKVHSIFDRDICFDHCSLRENCVAVETSEAGCQFCLNATYDSSRIQQANMISTYVKSGAMEGI